MLEKIPRAMALRAMIVVSLIVCSPAFLAAADLTLGFLFDRERPARAAKPIEAPPGMPIGDGEE